MEWNKALQDTSHKKVNTKLFNSLKIGNGFLHIFSSIQCIIITQLKNNINHCYDGAASHTAALSLLKNARSSLFAAPKININFDINF